MRACRKIAMSAYCLVRTDLSAMALENIGNFLYQWSSIVVPLDLYEDVLSNGSANQVVLAEFKRLYGHTDTDIRDGAVRCWAYLRSCATKTRHFALQPPISAAPPIHYFVDTQAGKAVVFYCVAANRAGVMTQLVALAFAQASNAMPNVSDTRLALARISLMPGRCSIVVVEPSVEPLSTMITCFTKPEPYWMMELVHARMSGPAFQLTTTTSSTLQLIHT